MAGRDDESGFAPLPDSGEVHIPEPPQDDAADPVESPAGSRSLADDLEALIDDARTYLDAELSYQKSRAGFVANRLKNTIAFALVAAFIAVLATIGLTVGLIIALTPLITAWGATAVVVLGLLFIAWLLVRKAQANWNSLQRAMNSGEESVSDD